MYKMNLKRIVALVIVSIAAIVVVACILKGPSGLYVGDHPLVAGDFMGAVYDNDNTPLENYKNEDVLITFYITYGYLRDVGDPLDGLAVTIGSQRGWGPFEATVKGDTDYGKKYVERSGAWTDIPGLSGNQGIRWRLHVPVTANGRLEKGENAYLYLWALENADNENSTKLQPSSKLLWDNGDNLAITVACRGDAFTTSWGTVRLFGQPWTV